MNLQLENKPGWGKNGTFTFFAESEDAAKSVADMLDIYIRAAIEDERAARN